MDWPKAIQGDCTEKGKVLSTSYSSHMTLCQAEYIISRTSFYLKMSHLNNFGHLLANESCVESGFVAFCSFFPCSLSVFHRGRQQKSGGRQ